MEDDGFEDIVNNNTADELALDDFDDVKKMFDKDDNVEYKYLILDKSDIVEKLLLDKDFDIVESRFFIMLRRTLRMPLLCGLLILFRN